MIYLSGIYILEDAGVLTDSLTAGIGRMGFRVHPQVSGDSDPAGKNIVEVSITGWRDGWTHIRILGDADSAGCATDVLVVQNPREKVIFCRYEPDLGEFSYSCLQAGQTVESFRCEGPGMESIAFSSDLRKVPVTKMLNVRAFMRDSLTAQGLEPRPEGWMPTVRLEIGFSLPDRSSPLKKFLGTIWSGTPRT